MIPPGRLDRPVDRKTDHMLGVADAEISLVEYGSYACPHCRAANDRIAQARDQLGDRVCYAVELAQTPEAFWSAHIKLMTRSMQLTEDDLVAVAADLGVNAEFALGDSDAMRRARARVEADVASSRASGVRFTPAFYINRRRYDGPWDENSLVDAMLGTLGHRVRPGNEFRLAFALPRYGAQPSISPPHLAEEVYARDFCLLRRLDRPDPRFHRQSSFGRPDESPVLEVLMSRRAMWQRPRRVGCNPHRDFSLMRALHPLRCATAGLQSFEAAL